MRHASKLAALTGALASLAAARPARADEPVTPRVALALTGDCAPDAAATEKIFGIELDARVVASAPDVTTAKVACDGARAVVVVVDPVTGKSVERRVDLSSFVESKGRARAVAIAAAELVSASWAEAALPPPRVPPAPSATTAPPAERAIVVARAATREPERARTATSVAAPSASLAALGGVRIFPDVALVGGAIRYETAAGRAGAAAFALAIDFGAAHGRATSTLGSVDADVIDGAGALAVSVPLTGPLAFRGGAGLRVGHAALTGHATSAPAEAGVVRGFATAPHAAAGLRAAIGAALFVEAGAELGAFVNGPRGAVVERGASTHIALRGGYLTGAAGAGATF